MTFISYAQNFEDVMLWRALKHIESGSYIDVGACSPDIHSVTRAFYDRGWSGINIEPNPEFYSQLKMRRLRDINLRIALDDKAETLTMNFFLGSGLSTLDETIAEELISAGRTNYTQEVEVATLASLWRQYVPKGQDVHFLKVDVEGLEEAVLRGNEWSKYRPWIVVVEATLPLSQQECYESWEHILLTADYSFAYADGLNRFYVAKEHAELLPAFKYPPNVFDDLKLNAQQQAEVKVQEAEAKVQEAEAKAQQAKANAHHWRTVANSSNRELQSMQASRSWRITAPLRACFDLLLKAKVTFAGIPQALCREMGAVIGSILESMIRFSMAHPALKSRAINLVCRHLRFDSWVHSFALSRGLIGGKSWQPDLSPHARRIYADLKAAVERSRRSN